MKPAAHAAVGVKICSLRGKLPQPFSPQWHGRTVGSDETNEKGRRGADADEESRGMASRAVGIDLGEAFWEERWKINNRS